MINTEAQTHLLDEREQTSLVSAHHTDYFYKVFLYVLMSESFGYLNFLCIDKNDWRKLKKKNNNNSKFVFQR